MNVHVPGEKASGMRMQKLREAVAEERHDVTDFQYASDSL
jgi:hypothetical protein